MCAGRIQLIALSFLKEREGYLACQNEKIQKIKDFREDGSNLKKICLREMREEADKGQHPTECENCDYIEATISMNV